MSPASCGSAQTSAPSFTCQPGRTPSRLKLCQPAKSTPLNNNFQPADFSASVNVLSRDSVLGGGSSPPPSARRSALASSFGTARASCFPTDDFHSSFNSASGLSVSSFHNSSVYFPWRQAALIFVIRLFDLS